MNQRDSDRRAERTLAHEYDRRDERPGAGDPDERRKSGAHEEYLSSGRDFEDGDNPESQRTFRQYRSGGAIPSPKRRDWEQQQRGGRDDDERYAGHERSDDSRDRGFGSPQYGYGPSGYAASTRSPYQENHGFGASSDRNHGGYGSPGGRGHGDFGSPGYDSHGGYGSRGGGYGAPGGRNYGGYGASGGGGSHGGAPGAGNYGSDYGGPGSGQRGLMRRDNDEPRGPHRGVGPRNYSRSDERIKEDVSDALTDDDEVDASEIDVSVKSGEVTLSGTVNARHMKRIAEDIAERVRGVRDVHNQIRVKSSQ